MLRATCRRSHVPRAARRTARRTSHLALRTPHVALCTIAPGTPSTRHQAPRTRHFTIAAMPLPSLALLLAVTLLSMSLRLPSMAAQAQRAAPTGENALRTLIEDVRQKPAVGVRGTRLQHPDAVARFYETRAFTTGVEAPRGRRLDPQGDPGGRGRRPDAGRLPSRRHHRRARSAQQDPLAADDCRRRGAHRRCRGGAGRRRALRAGAAGDARPAVERRPARRHAGARHHARSDRAITVSRRRHRGAQAESLHLHRAETGAGRGCAPSKRAAAGLW